MSHISSFLGLGVFESFKMLRISNDASEGIKCLQGCFDQTNHKNNMSSYPENRPEIDKYYDLIINDNTNSINAMLKRFVLRERLDMYHVS